MNEWKWIDTSGTLKYNQAKKFTKKSQEKKKRFLLGQSGKTPATMVTVLLIAFPENLSTHHEEDIDVWISSYSPSYLLHIGTKMSGILLDFASASSRSNSHFVLGLLTSEKKLMKI